MRPKSARRAFAVRTQRIVGRPCGQACELTAGVSDSDTSWGRRGRRTQGWSMPDMLRRIWSPSRSSALFLRTCWSTRRGSAPGSSA